MIALSLYHNFKRYAQKFGLQPMDVDDILQEMLRRSLLIERQYKSLTGNDLKRLCMRSGVNLIKDFLKLKHARDKKMFSLDGLHIDIEDKREIDMTARVKELLSHIPQESKEIIVSLLKGYSYRETARVCNTTIYRIRGAREEFLRSAEVYL